MDEDERVFYDSITPRSYIIRYRSQVKFYWDILIIIVAIYNSVTLPMQISFEQVDEVFRETTYLLSIEYFIDFLFFVDIGIGFLTSY